MKTEAIPAREASLETGRQSGAPPPPAWLVVMAFAAVYLIWSSTFLGIRIAIETLPPLLMAGARFLFSGLILYPIMRRTGAPRPEAVHWRNATIIGALLLLAGNGGVTWAEQKVPTGIAALLVAATPLWMIVLDWLRPNGHRPHGLVFGGLFLGFAGVALIVASRDRLGNTLVDPVGAVVLLLSSLCWAVGSVFSRDARQPSSALLAIAMQMITGGVILILAGAAMGEVGHVHVEAITARSIWAFVYLTFFGSLIGFTAYVWLLGVSAPARVSTYAYVNPLIAVILGRIFLAEPLPASVLVSGALIIAAVVLITVKGQRQP